MLLGVCETSTEPKNWRALPPQIALAILYEACLWRQPDAKLAVVLYTPSHQEAMETAMAKLVDESDCYSTAQQACVRYFRYLKDVMSAMCIPSEVP